MADAVRASDASIDTTSGIYAPLISGNLIAAEALPALAPCRVNAGAVELSDGTANNAAADCHGFTARDYAIGEAVDLFGPGVIAKFAAGTLTPGTEYYVSTNAGELSDAATTGGLKVIAWALDASHIVLGAPMN